MEGPPGVADDVAAGVALGVVEADPDVPLVTTGQDGLPDGAAPHALVRAPVL